MSDVLIRGSCLCGKIRFEIRDKPLFMSSCHCTRCRKAGGSTTVAVHAEQLRWLKGEDLVVRYRPEPPYHIVRCFCGRCGTYLGEPDPGARGFPIAAAALDGDPGVRRVLHEHVAERAPWYEIDDELPQFPGHPPGLGGDGPAADE